MTNALIALLALSIAVNALAILKLRVLEAEFFRLLRNAAILVDAIKQGAVLNTGPKGEG